MARRKDHSHDEIRQLALSALMQLLETTPMQQVSLRQIAHRIDYAPSTLIKIFGSYRYLLLACSGQVLMQLLQHLSQIEAEFPEDKLQAMALTYYEYANQNVHKFNLVFELKMESDEVLPQSQMTLISLLLEQLEQEVGLLAPVLNTAELEMASRSFWGGIHGLTLLSLKDKLFSSGLDVPRLLTEQVRIFTNGIKHTLSESHHTDTCPLVIKDKV